MIFYLFILIERQKKIKGRGEGRGWGKENAVLHEK